jgi:biotin carboxylase
MKTLWMVSGGVEAVPGILRAKEMGYFVVVSDGNPHAPGFEFCDHSVVVSTYDESGTVKAARDFHKNIRPVHGVISVASDIPLTVASVANDLGLPGMSLKSARMASDKLAMKDRLSEAGIPVPWYRAISNVNDLRDSVLERRFPLVIKPVDSRGARGVLRLLPDTDLEWAFGHSMSFSPTSRVMVEQFLEGPQVSTESVLMENYAATPGFSDRNYEFLERFSPYIIENGGQQPSSLRSNEQNSTSRLAEMAGRALGITTGIVKGDMVHTSDGPMVIEIAPRLSGGWFCTDQIPLATGVDLLGSAIRLSLGESVPEEELVPRYQKGVAIRYFFPNPGRIQGISSLQRFWGMSWIHKMNLYVKQGETINPVTDHTKRAGFVITSGKSREQAVERAEFVCRNVAITTEPV